MSSQPWAADWEHIVGLDLVPHLLPAGQPQTARRPVGASLPEDAHAALSASLGRIEPGDLLVVPAAAWQWHRWRRRSLYTPDSVAGIGERGTGLWVRALPAPGVRVRVPFSSIAAVEYQTDGPWRVLTVTGQAGRLQVRYSEDGQTGAEEWVRRLRFRAAPAPVAVPIARPGGQGPRAGLDLGALLLDPADEIAWAGWRSRARRAECLLAATSREVTIVQTLTGCVRRRRGIRRTLYLPRRSLEGVAVRAEGIRVRSAGTDVHVRLWSGKVAAAASSWLGQVFTGRDRSDAGSWPGQPDSV